MKIPKVIKVKQTYDQPKVADVKAEIKRLLKKYNLSERIEPGQKIAITAGSRGISNIPAMLAQVVQEVKDCGGKPFLIPAMGSHAGGTAEGQKQMLESLGITEQSVNAPILSSMEVVRIGTTDFNTPVYLDKYAYEADGIIVMNRIKKHTDHTNKTESGLMKMMTIGMGKQKQADLVHSYGVWGLQNLIPATAKVVINKMNVVAGIAIIENALDETAYLEVVEPNQIPQREPELFKMANELYPWLPFTTCDVLVIKKVGKNISGTGMDTNLIGRMGVWGGIEPEKIYATGSNDFGYPLIEHIVVLDVTDESHGNVIGIGQADVITKKLFEKIDFQATYNNVITAKFLDKGKIPVIAENDKNAIQIALDTLNGLVRLEGKKDTDTVRLCVIESTLHEGNYLVSRGLYQELKTRGDIETIGDFQDLQFDREGDLLN